MGRPTTEQDLFLEAVAGTRPLAAGDRDRVRTISPPRGTPRPEPVLPPPVALSIDREGVVISARAPGVNRVPIAELRGGRIRPEDTLDLHGHTAAQATAALRRFLLEAARLRRRCVLVIHGRGLHSDGVAVLRDAVIEQLVGELSGLVHAFATAPRSAGGEGATLVMVRWP